MLDLIARTLERPLVVPASPARPLDAIVVLGATLAPNGQMTPVLAERVTAAAALWRAGAGRFVLVTGGVTQRRPRAEADAMAEGLRALGVTELVIERAAQTTRDNAALSAPLLRAAGARSLWIVTQPFHARRGARLFRAQGFDAHAWHIADSLEYRDRRRAVTWLIREYAAWAALLARR